MNFYAQIYLFNSNSVGDEGVQCIQRQSDEDRSYDFFKNQLPRK